MQVDAVAMSRYRMLMEEAAEKVGEDQEAHAQTGRRLNASTVAYEAARERYIAYLEGQATIMEGA